MTKLFESQNWGKGDTTFKASLNNCIQNKLNFMKLALCCKLAKTVCKKGQDKKFINEIALKILT